MNTTTTRRAAAAALLAYAEHTQSRALRHVDTLAVERTSELVDLPPTTLRNLELLRTLAGLLPAEDGGISLSPPSATVGYLPQEHERRDGETVLDDMVKGEIRVANAELDDMVLLRADGTPDRRSLD